MTEMVTGPIGAGSAPQLYVDGPAPKEAPYVVSPPLVLDEAVPKWSFHALDGSASYVFDRNPNKAGPTFATRDLDWNLARGAGGGTFTGTRAPRTPVRWNFSGVLHTESQYDAFTEWVARKRQMRIVTDLGEVHLARLLSFAPVQVPGRNPWRHTYDITALLYDEIRPAGDLSTFITGPGGGGGAYVNPYRMQITGERLFTRVMVELMSYPPPTYAFWQMAVRWTVDQGAYQPPFWQIQDQLYPGTERYAVVAVRAFEPHGGSYAGDGVTLRLQAVGGDLLHLGAPSQVASITHVTGSGPSATTLAEDNRVRFIAA